MKVDIIYVLSTNDNNNNNSLINVMCFFMCSVYVLMLNADNEWVIMYITIELKF